MNKKRITINEEDNEMKLFKKILKNIGKADKNIWGYVML